MAVTFNQSLFDENLQYLESFFFITNCSAINSLIACCFIILPVSLWGRFLEVGLLNQRTNTYLILLDIAKLPF